MSTDVVDDTDLERRLRAACHAKIPRLLEGEPTSSRRTDPTSLPVVTTRSPSGAGARPRALAAAAAVVGIGIAGLVAVSASDRPDARNAAPHSTPAAPSSTTMASTLSTTSTISTVPAGGAPVGTEQCDDAGCSDFDPLPLDPAASEFYVGDPSLGAPTIELDWFTNLTRCLELSADGTTCTALEGIAGLPLVSYVDPATGASIEIGTTFTFVGPQAYAGLWGPTQGGGSISETTVRGHPAVRYENEARPALVWEERPGVLAWVAVDEALEDRLSDIAATIQPTDGPTSVPHRVVVAGHGTPWDAEDNTGDGLLVAVADGQECVGFGYVPHCGGAIVDRTVARPRQDGTTAVTGSAAAEAVAVRITTEAGTTTVNTDTFGPYDSRFFSAGVATGPVLTVEWLDAHGAVLAADSLPTATPDSSELSGRVLIVDASGIPGHADRVAAALRAGGITVAGVEPAQEHAEQTMLMPLTTTPSAFSTDLLRRLDIGGFDTWNPLLIEPDPDAADPPASASDALVLGADGGPTLPVAPPLGTVASAVTTTTPRGATITPPVARRGRRRR